MKKVLLLLITCFLFSGTPAQTTLMYQDFSNANGWSGWSRNNFYFSHYFTIPVHGYIAFINEGDTDASNESQRLTSPPVDLSSVSSAFFSASVFFLEQSYLGHTETLNLQISTDNGISWTNLTNITGHSEWHEIFADITPYCGNASVLLSLLYSDDTGWLYGAGIDDCRVFTTQDQDLSLTLTNGQDFWPSGQTFPLRFTVRNLGSQPVTSFTASYKVNGGTPQPDSRTGLNLLPGDTLCFTHSAGWLPGNGSQEVQYSITEVNGGSDPLHSNDSATFLFRSAISTTPQKNVVLNLLRATWCTLCGYTDEIVTNTLNLHPGRILPVIMMDYTLNPDEIYMYIYSGVSTAFLNAYDNYFSSVTNDASWLSRGTIDHYDFRDIYGKCIEYNGIVSKLEERLQHYTPVSVNATAELVDSSRTLNIEMNAQFFADLQGDFRFNCLLLKDSIMYYQSNWFHDAARWPYWGSMSMVPFNNILIQSSGGRYGTLGSIPYSVNDGSVYTWHDTIHIKDSLLSLEDLHLLFMVEEYDSASGKSVILNAGIWPEQTVSAPKKSNLPGIIHVYPNPAGSQITLDIENKLNEDGVLTIYNQCGQNVLSRRIRKGTRNCSIEIDPLPKGLYIISLPCGTGKFIKQ